MVDKRETGPVEIFQTLFFALALGCLLVALATLFFGPSNFLQNSPYPFLAIVVGLIFLLKFTRKRGE